MADASEHVISWSLASDPRNWVIIFLVLYLVALIAHMLYSNAGSAPIQLPAGIGL
jgi:hypothetical protein